VTEKGEETPLNTGDFALVNTEGLTSEIPMKNTSTAIKGDKPFKMICGVPKEFE